MNVDIRASGVTFMTADGKTSWVCRDADQAAKLLPMMRDAGVGAGAEKISAGDASAILDAKAELDAQRKS